MSTFSILSWCFFLIAVVSALILTTMSTPLIRRYRGILLSLVTSGLILGLVTALAPMVMRKFNPDQSRLIPLDQLTLTQWVEPLSNPETSLNEDEISWLKNIPYHFKYKLGFDFDVLRIIAIQDSNIVLLDQKGNLRGFDAYSGVNHWSIAIGAVELVRFIQVEKKLYLLDRPHPDMLRMTCFDLQSPAMLWQRMIPNSKEGEISFDYDTQSLLVSTGVNGIWALKAKTGEILWKRPEIYSKTLPLYSPKHVLVFEPVVTNKMGSWYFLDSQTGKTLQKLPHVYPEVQKFLAADPEHEIPQYFLAQVNSTQFFYMNHVDLSQLWTFNAQEPVEFTQSIDGQRYFVVYQSKRIEQRTSKTNELIWQKLLTEIDPKWLKITPDRKYFILPKHDSNEVPGVAFFNVENGDYVFTAKTSESILDASFYGNWFYLLSENHIWAFQRETVVLDLSQDKK